MAITGLGPEYPWRHGDADARGCPEARVFGLGGDPLQRAQRTRNEQEHAWSSSEVMVKKRNPVSRVGASRQMGETIFSEAQ
jgi:hypothetical protein